MKTWRIIAVVTARLSIVAAACIFPACSRQADVEQIAADNRKIAELQAEVTRLQELSAAHKTISQSSLASNENTVSTVRQQLKEARAESATLRQSLVSKSGDTELAQSVQSLQSQLDDAEAQVKTLQNELDDANARLRAASDAITALRQTQPQAQGDMSQPQQTQAQPPAQ